MSGGGAAFEAEAGQSQGETGGEQRDPCHVEAAGGRCSGAVVGQEPGQDGRGGEADGEVEPERPAPAGVVGQQPADDRTAHHAEHHHRGQDRLHPDEALRPGGRMEVADQGHAESEQGSGTQTLHGAGGDQHRHGPGQAAGERGDQEYGESAEQ